MCGKVWPSRLRRLTALYVQLEVGSSTEAVNVTESAPFLKTESGEPSHHVTTNTMDSLPIMGIGATAGTAPETFVLNPNAWLNPPAGQFGTAAPYYSDYRDRKTAGAKFVAGTRFPL